VHPPKLTKAKIKNRKLLEKKNASNSSNDQDDKKFYLKRVSILENPMNKLPSLSQHTNLKPIISEELDFNIPQWKCQLAAMNLLDRPPLNLTTKRNRKFLFKPKRVKFNPLANTTINTNCLKPIITRKEMVEQALGTPIKHRMIKQVEGLINNTESYTVN